MKILEFILGTVSLRFSEGVRTKVFSELFDNRIKILSVENESNGFHIRLSGSDAKRFLTALEGSGIEPTRTVMRGLPVCLRQLLRRSGILLGLFLGIALFLLCRSRIWQIELSGNGEIDPDLLLEELRLCGLEEGRAFRKTDQETVAFEMLKLERRISWIQIRREGVRVIVEWLPTKQVDSELQIPDGVGANLVSAKDAVIVDVQLEQGEACVAVGSVVHAGDLLVSGVGTHSARYASGRIIGRVGEQISVTVPLATQEISSVKVKSVGLTVNLLGFDISVGKREGELAEHGTVYLFGRIRLPIFWERTFHSEYELQEVCLSEADAARLASKMLSDKLAVLLSDGELLRCDLSGSYENGGYTLTADIEYLINIAKTLEFSLENE